MVDFSGWWMPLQYEGILAEHHRTRTAVTMFDTCHMGRLMVTGANAMGALARAVTVDVEAMQDGQCKYGFLLRDDGGILDDLIVYRFGAQKWMVVVNAGTRDKDVRCIRERLGPGVSFEDVSARMAKLDVQGPRALAAVSAVMAVDLQALRYFRFTTASYKGSEAVVSRTGYTGESGCEIYVPAGKIAEVWQAFLDAGVTPAGLGARDTLRLEAGLPLYGHELTEDITPVEAGMERYAAKAGDFVGREAVYRRQQDGAAIRLCGFRIPGRQSARAGNRVFADGADAGWVTSGSFSPTLQGAIGFAYVQAAQARLGNRVAIDTGRARLDAEVVGIPFYKAQQTGKQT